jgi:pyruvate/2-oxoglutarate dehydrogenase complex dihydrolipoamide dehydrogenase (E3) component
MVEILRPDLCVLGAGAGGIAAACAAAATGASVVLVEKRRLEDGRPNPGLLSNVVIEAARATALGRRRSRASAGPNPLDSASSKSTVDIAALRRRAQKLADRLALDTPIRLAALNIKTIEGTARFTGRKSCAAGGVTIEPKWFVVAAGGVSEPATEIKGFELIRPLELESFLDLEHWPRRLLLLGGSAHGMALAQAFCRLGSQVQLIESGTFLPGEDRELVSPILTRLQREGVGLHENATVVRIKPLNSGMRIDFAKMGCDLDFEATHMMLTTPLSPRVEGLGLDEAGVDYDRNGIKVRGDLRTSNPSIYAIGDVLGGLSSLGNARAQGRRVVAQIFEARRTIRPQVARFAFTDPEFAAVGMSETEARNSHRNIRVLRARFHENAAAQLAGDANGHVKIITDARDRLLGVGIVGPQARELIGAYGLALSQRLRISDLRDFVPPTPSLAEAGSLAALALPGQLGKALWRRMFPVTRRFN